jgi:hypothetical protein
MLHSWFRPIAHLLLRGDLLLQRPQGNFLDFAFTPLCHSLPTMAIKHGYEKDVGGCWL